jgi:hypothetical protein
MKPEHLKTSTAGRVIRTPRGYWIFIPNPLPPTIRWSSSFISAIGIAERALGKPDSLANTLPSAHIFA